MTREITFSATVFVMNRSSKDVDVVVTLAGIVISLRNPNPLHCSVINRSTADAEPFNTSIYKSPPIVRVYALLLANERFVEKNQETRVCYYVVVDK